jgi:DNA-binding transcriptional LysR family regulator
MSDRVQQLWQLHDMQRTVALRSPNFLSAPIILAESDLIATLPLKIARMFVRGGRLKIVPFPLQVGQFDLEMVWHPLLEKDPPQQWFREQLKVVAGELERE